MGDIIPFTKPEQSVGELPAPAPVMTEGEIAKAFDEPDQFEDIAPPNPITTVATKTALAGISREDTAVHEETGYGDLVRKRIDRSVEEVRRGCQDIRYATTLDLEGHGWQRLGVAVEAIEEIAKYRPNEVFMFERGYQASQSRDLTAKRADRITKSDALNKIASHIKNRIAAQDDPSVAQLTIASINPHLVTNKEASRAYDSVLDGMQDFFDMYRIKPTETADQVMRRFSNMLARQAGLVSRNPRDMPIGLIDQAWRVVSAAKSGPPQQSA